MRISEIMKTGVETIEPQETAARARQVMTSRGVRHLVVCRDGRAVGVVSQRDVGGPRGAAPDGTVAAVMSRGVVTVPPDATLRQAANLLRGHVIGCLPVMEEGRLKGIVTISDVLDVLGRGDAHMRGHEAPYVARRQGPLGKPRQERMRARGRRA